MKWCMFQSENKSAYGIIEEDTVFEVSGTLFGPYTKTSPWRIVSHVLSKVSLICNYNNHTEKRISV